jgi:cellulose biosynthesis protein BcsQ
VEQILRNVHRISQRRGGPPRLAGIVVNRLGRTRDAAYWAEELRRAHPGQVLASSVRLRAAVTEAAAQSLPVHAIARSGSAEAVGEFEALAAELFGAPLRIDLAAPSASSELTGQTERREVVEVGVGDDERSGDGRL